jgi:hypothetical protein
VCRTAGVLTVARARSSVSGARCRTFGGPAAARGGNQAKVRIRLAQVFGHPGRLSDHRTPSGAVVMTNPKGRRTDTGSRQGRRVCPFTSTGRKRTNASRSAPAGRPRIRGSVAGARATTLLTSPGPDRATANRPPKPGGRREPVAVPPRSIPPRRRLGLPQRRHPAPENMRGAQRLSTASRSRSRRSGRPSRRTPIRSRCWPQPTRNGSPRSRRRSRRRRAGRVPPR